MRWSAPETGRSPRYPALNCTLKGNGVDLKDLDELPESTASTASTMVTNAVHLVELLRTQPFPPLAD